MSPGPTPAAARSGPGTAQQGVNPTAHATTSPAPTPLVSPTDPKTLVTRFGAVTVDSAHLIGFENGLFGFARHQRFLLTEVPGRDVAFKLLQAVDDPELNFLVLPLDPENGPIARPTSRPPLQPSASPLRPWPRSPWSRCAGRPTSCAAPSTCGHHC